MTAARAIAVLGSASNVGKTTIAAGLCRLLADDGVRVAPFKAQNMDSRVFQLPDGRYISWAQWWQAKAAGIEPTPDLNPIVLRPMSHMRSQVIVHGHILDIEAADEWMRKVPARFLHVQEAYDRLRKSYDAIVIEGAGSAAEINLWKTDLVNWRTVRHANARVVLVGDISNGGIFAQLIGTVNLLPPEDRARICGLVVNQFRGDRNLFDDGVTLLEHHTGIPVLGVVPTLDILTDDKHSAEASLGTLATHLRGNLDLAPIRVALAPAPADPPTI